jgi:hypothetical protein
VTIRWFTDADRDEQARVSRERLERDELWWAYVRWVTDRAGHDGVIHVPQLPLETEERLLRLLREGTIPPAS